MSRISTLAIASALLGGAALMPTTADAALLDIVITTESPTMTSPSRANNDFVGRRALSSFADYWHQLDAEYQQYER